MDRRRFVLTSLAGICAAPLGARGQISSKSARVGFVTGVTSPSYLAAFREALRQHGWSEGQNLVLDFQTAHGEHDRVAALAADVMARKPNVVVLTATSAHVLKQIVESTPVVFVVADDPVRLGLVPSLARPGRATGVTSLNVELDAKRLEILKQAMPGVIRVAVVTAPQDSAHRDRVMTIERAAKALGVHVSFMNVYGSDDVPRAFQAAMRLQAGAVMLLGSPLLLRHQAQTLELAAKARLPLIAAWSEFAELGGLMTYGTNVSAMFRHAAAVTNRILRGTNPADIPVERATTFELVINRRTAQTLQIDIPAAITLRADRVID